MGIADADIGLENPFRKRRIDAKAQAMGDEPLFGAGMDLVLSPATQILAINPASSYVPVAPAK
ncbi:MAG: hypothetical protein KGZ83_00860 [Sulfuricella sp.]|nr:hypothetical protein [Sulfuricella sp.]